MQLHGLRQLLADLRRLFHETDGLHRLAGEGERVTFGFDGLDCAFNDGALGGGIGFVHGFRNLELLLRPQWLSHV